VPPTEAERKIIAMCEGRASMFSEREEKLLKLAAGRPNLAEAAEALTTKRAADLRAACERLRAEGKM
jgi:hypothetical protein